MPTLKPQAGPQSEFLAASCELVIYGGGAGGGKSYGLVLDPVRYLTRVPNFHGVIFRRTYPEITAPGGLWDTSGEVYGLLPEATAVPSDRLWRFEPHGNTIRFRHLQHESSKYHWQGSQVTYFGFDEMSHFTEGLFTYVGLSRGRSACSVPSYIRGSCNPDPGWLKTFLAPWVDRQFESKCGTGEIDWRCEGPPRAAASGEPRWFVREEGKMRWVDRSHPDAKSMTFIGASVYDNPILLGRNPRYISSLKALLPIERARLLDGDWDVRREGLVYPEFESCIVDQGPPAAPEVGGIDFGFSNPFAAVWGHVDHDGVLWITGTRYARQATLPTHAEAIPRGVRYWCDPAQPESRVELRVAGHDAIPCVHLSARGAGGEKRTPILHGIDVVTERIRSGRLKVVRAACLPLIREAGMYCYDPEKKSENPIDDDNHGMDACRYLCVGLDRGRMIRVPAPAPATPAPIAPDLDDERFWQ